MSNPTKQNAVFRFFWKLDSVVSAAVFESFDFLRRSASAYSSFLYRFRLSGPRRLIVDLADDAATFGTVFAFGLLAYALPPFSGTGDVWNKGREYAVTFTDANGEIIGRRGIRQDDAIPLEDIPPHMIKAVLATEDSRFYQHFGIDLQGTLRAIVQNAKADGVSQGGSSLTQQVAKNLFLTPERTIKRKVHEAFLALWIEARLTKDEILKLYLDRSYMGGGNYGVEAAAQYYFGKSIRDVSLAESAMLAGLFKAPTKYAPHNDLAAARSRANVVLYRMLDAGFITQGELVQARRDNVAIVDQKIIESPDWFLDWAYKDTLALIEEQNLESNFVIEVKTTIDLKLQQAAQKIVNAVLETEAAALDANQASSVTMTPDGAVRAIVGGRDYEDSQFNRATDALRQPGSSFKPFVYLAALMDGMTPDTIVVDGPVSIGNWSPKNYTGKYAGRTTLRNALAHSYNSVPVKLSLQTGRKKIIETAHLAGLQSEVENVASMPLGTSAVTLLDITTAYATFAAGGKQAKPYTVTEIRRPTGEVIFSRDVNSNAPVQVLPFEKVAELNDMMHAVVASGTGTKANLGFAPSAGKTGTNQSYRDAWFVGFSANNVTGVWFGNDDFSEMKKVTGGMLPAPTWRKIMLEAERGFAVAALPGVPLDESYAQFAEENPPYPAGTPSAEPALRTATVETGETDVETVKPKPEQDAVVAVLKDMFGLFDETNAARPQKVRKIGPRSAKKRQTRVTLILPEPNTAKKRKRLGEFLAVRRNSAFDKLRERQKIQGN